MALTLEETKVTVFAPFTEMLTDLQAHILKHHGRKFAQHLFLAIKPGKIEAARKFLSSFALSKITSAGKQLVDAANRKVNKAIDGGTIFTLSLTAKGYEKLEIPTNLRPTDQAFLNGMKASSKKLSDQPELWEEEFKQEIHLLIIVADSLENTLNKKVSELVIETQDFFNLLKKQKGETLKRGEIGIEHFGYADGVSQPLFLAEEIANQTASGNDLWNDEAMLKLALVSDNGGRLSDSYGSFLVFRKLEQNVKKFKEEEEKLPSVVAEDGKENDELAGAMIVGRFEDGTEVINHSHEKGIVDEKKLNNNFNYETENSSSKCPFHAHIRITNPRADVGVDFAKSVRLVRRGIPYDEIGRRSLDELPEFGVGLLFMCYQQSIEDQFEFIQSAWANKGQIGDNPIGQDGIIGQGENDFQKKLPVNWGNDSPTNDCDFSNPKSGFVKMKGGEYFFTPSISFLKTLF